MIKILEMESSKGWGGQEKRTVRLVNNLPKDEYKIFWAVEKDSTLYKKKDEINAELFAIKLNKIYNLKIIFFLCKFVKKNKIDIISTHSGKDAWIGNIVGLLTNTKIVRVRHLIVPVKPLSYNLASKVVTVSNQVKNYLITAGVKKEKLVNIYTGIDTNRFNSKLEYDLRKDLGIAPTVKLIGVVAVLRRAKRHKELIETFMNLNDNSSKLVIVGDGPQMQNIKKQIEDNSLEERVFLLGHRADVSKILPNFDIFVLASEHEALGTSLLEAQSCGVPVIASNVGGIPEALENSKTGLLFDDFNMLESHLNKLLTDEKSLQEFKKNCREFILEKFSVEKMMYDTEKLYKELVK